MAVKAGLKVNAVVVADETEMLGVNDKLQLAAVEAAYRRRRAEELMKPEQRSRIRPLRRARTGHGRARCLHRRQRSARRQGHAGRSRAHRTECLAQERRGRCRHDAVSELRDRRRGDRSECNIGPFARFRPSSRLSAGVHIGNFVEVKNSVIGPGTKANHLTYLGDTTIGTKTNVGAGTVTCNYDGVNKSRTEIGDRAFIGSGTMLVAPVKVGDGATIGAGSTITHDAPADKLTLERSKQITIDRWKRPQKKT
jgi:bifunctional UDP-N-acetylglucosamine pyrophosphorylase/glucosamine-1-phosphate N-acetyltransferase